MGDRLIAEVLTFLRHYHDKTSPLLLGFSGGPDSLALLHLLLQVKKIHPFRLALAHVDHGWRPESGAEAEQIREMGSALGLPVHSITLSPDVISGNPEAYCREERLKFFASLCLENGYQAVLLAHHADDLAETVLKRILEGAALSNLGGIRPTSTLFGVNVWRPLLQITKKEILHWLQERGLVGFCDSTNLDPKFLRARLRMDVLPYLSQIFGKEVCSGLCHVGNESAELIEYLDTKIMSHMSCISSGPFGSYLDLNGLVPIESLELKHLIRRFCEQIGVNLSRESLALTAGLIAEGCANKKINDNGLYVDRRKIFGLRGPLPRLPDVPIHLPEEGVVYWGAWRVEVLPCQEGEGEDYTDWRSLWQGTGLALLPAGSYKLAPPQLHNPFYSGTLSKFWTQHKVPAFLRGIAPVILEGDSIVHEFLTGKFVQTAKTMQSVKVTYVASSS